MKSPLLAQWIHAFCKYIECFPYCQSSWYVNEQWLCLCDDMFEQIEQKVNVLTK